MKHNYKITAVLLLVLAFMNACKNNDIDIDTFTVEDNARPTATGVTISGSYSFSGNVNGMKVNIGLDKELGDAEVYDMELERTNFSFSVDGVLIPDTTYYYCYSVDLGRDTPHLTEIDSFATLAATSDRPVVQILDYLPIDDDSLAFRVKCKVLLDGGAEVTERGICYNTFGDPSIEDPHNPTLIDSLGVGTGVYYVYMRNLAPGKRYYVRAYAKNAAGKLGESDGPPLEIKTASPQGTTVEIGVAANPVEGGRVEGGGTYAEGSVIELNAIPNLGYSFDHWQDGNRDIQRTITVTVDTTYTAYFTPLNTVATPTFTPDAGTYNDAQNVTISCATNGATIYYTMDGSEPTTSSTEYESEITVSETTTLKAMAVKEGMLNSAVAMATYNIVPLYNITIDEDIEHGTVTASDTTAPEGTPITMTNTADTGYHFGEWHVTSTLGDVTVTDNTFIMPAADVTVSASFEPDTLMIRVYAEPSNGGTVSIISEGINYGNSQSFAYGTTIQLNATANNGYHFDRWSDDGGQTHSVQVKNSKEYVAYFYENGQTADQTFSVGNVSFKMKYVEGGTYWMGAQSINVGGQNYDVDAEDSESPVHSVTISTFYMGETEVTQELWQAVMGSNPSNFSGTNLLPVEQVSWNDCQEFIHKLNRLTNSNFRLPTEAEWEYAARGGNQSHGYKYAGSNTIGNVAWYTGNSNSQTHPVGTKAPNELGLYDMSGNVYEWCNDYFDNYSSGSQTNPQGPSSGSSRSLRGGSWNLYQGSCRGSFRGHTSPSNKNRSIGFRLVLSQ